MEEVPRDVRIARDAARRRVQDVRSVQFEQLMACTTSSDLSAAESELHATMQKISNLVHEVREALEESESPTEVHALEQALREDQSALDALKRESRRMLLAAHRKVQASRERSHRGALRLSSTTAPAATKLNAAKEDQTQTTSQDVHTALQRTVALMSSELEKSGYSAQLLEESSENLTQISESYASFGTLLHDSIDLIRQMERAELWDWAILVMSLSFFVGCVLYILYVRVISRGLSLLNLLYRATSLAKRQGKTVSPLVHTASISAAAVSTALRRSPAEAPRKVLEHRENPSADAGHEPREDLLSSVATKSSRARGARRGVDARRKAEAFRNAEEQALTESSEERIVDPHTQFGDEQAEQLIQSIEAKFSESPSEYVLDPLLRTLTDSPKTQSARKPRRKMGTVDSSPILSTSSPQAAGTTRSDTPSPTANVQNLPTSDAPEPPQHGSPTTAPISDAPFAVSESQDTQSQSVLHVTEPIQPGMPQNNSNLSNPESDTLNPPSSSQHGLHESTQQEHHLNVVPGQLNNNEVYSSDSVPPPVAAEDTRVNDDASRQHDEELNSQTLEPSTLSSAIGNVENSSPSSIVNSGEDYASLPIFTSQGDSEPLSISDAEQNLTPSSITDTKDQDILGDANSYTPSTPEEPAQQQTDQVESQENSFNGYESSMTAASPTPIPSAASETFSASTTSSSIMSHSGNHSHVVAALSSASASLRAAAPTLDPTVVDVMWKKLNAASESLEKALDPVSKHSSLPTLSSSHTTEPSSEEQGSDTALPLLTKASAFGEQLLSRVVPEFAMNTQSATSHDSLQHSDEQDIYPELISSEPSATNQMVHDEL